jgi:Family of unknown function (DUF6081)
MNRTQVVGAGLASLVALGLPAAGTRTAASAAEKPRTTVVMYDNFEKPGGYTLADYLQKWSNKLGPGEMAVRETRKFDGGAFSVDAVPFRTGHDAGIFDHIKYFAASTETFRVPRRGSLEFSADITGETPGTQPGHVIHGTYGPPYSYPTGKPYQATLLEGQQAMVSLHMIDFRTGELFDWMVTDHFAYPLVERLPSSVTDPTIHPGDPRYVGRDKMQTQFIDQLPISSGRHNFAIRLTRTETTIVAEYFIDRRLVAKVDRVGIPLDVQGVPYTGVYPSLGPGELLVDEMDSVNIGHGLLSCVDAFPFQHPESPELSVSIPLSERLFGQGARGAFDNFTVTTLE